MTTAARLILTVVILVLLGITIVLDWRGYRSWSRVTAYVVVFGGLYTLLWARRRG